MAAPPPVKQAEKASPKTKTPFTDFPGHCYLQPFTCVKALGVGGFVSCGGGPLHFLWRTVFTSKAVA